MYFRTFAGIYVNLIEVKPRVVIKTLTFDFYFYRLWIGKRTRREEGEGVTQIIRRARIFTEAVFFFFLPAWCFLVVDTFTLPGNAFHDFFMSASGKAILVIAQLILGMILLEVFLAELEMRKLKGTR